MLILAFESSCDETSAAVVRDGAILSNVVSSQTALHAEYGGVVPELAAREHLLNLIPVVRKSVADAGTSADRIDAVAATRGPGLPSALMVGLKAGQALAFFLRRPFIGIHHHEAHLYSPWIGPSAGKKAASDSRATDDPRGSLRTTSPTFSEFEPNVSLIVSGGHTMLVHVESVLRHRVLGSTLDDAAGECFDKAGKLLGLPYPAGPIIDAMAQSGNPKAYDFPRPMMNDAGDDFSFSGLKTSVRYFLRDHPELAEDEWKVRDLCASVQSAIVDVLVTKTVRAAKRLRVNWVTASGGVTCNRELRERLAGACAQNRLKLRLAEKSLCTDNAGMIGILAEKKLSLGCEPTGLDEDIEPGWELG
ncbi:MAG TPA: tRNA (adenosine(37)-N6)-threonylcarbamoyltransferase complex transferase subunit TsaD [Candidatus Dormibacteraeota bacterium]|nr:tRNA (adenosine(37)-N6)-threonylcarbamoyltransferase complex transferase subunit TsaD [Candidatus Dormibacteraeota bacterium]